MDLTSEQIWTGLGAILAVLGYANRDSLLGTLKSLFSKASEGVEDAFSPNPGTGDWESDPKAAWKAVVSAYEYLDDATFRTLIESHPCPCREKALELALHALGQKPDEETEHEVD